LTHLVARNLPHGLLAGLLGARLQLCRLLEEVAHRRRLHNEGEGLVLVVGDHHRDGRALLHLLALRVERLAEFHDVDAALTKRRADRGRRRRRPRGHLKLELACNFLSHLSSALSSRPATPFQGWPAGAILWVRKVLPRPIRPFPSPPRSEP